MPRAYWIPFADLPAHALPSTITFTGYMFMNAPNSQSRRRCSGIDSDTPPQAKKRVAAFCRAFQRGMVVIGITGNMSCVPERKAWYSTYRTGDMRAIVVIASELEDTQNRVVCVVSGTLPYDDQAQAGACALMEAERPYSRASLPGGSGSVDRENNSYPSSPSWLAAAGPRPFKPAGLQSFTAAAALLLQATLQPQFSGSNFWPKYRRRLCPQRSLRGKSPTWAAAPSSVGQSNPRRMLLYA
ncbi:hypothetical protein V8D89_005844 [Ganoderma adspersum]